jgi:hypothetical protein
MTTEPVIDALLAMDARDVPPVDTALQAIAAYAESVLVATDGMWPPAARATACREGLLNIAAECRRESAATTTDEETTCPR